MPRKKAAVVAKKSSPGKSKLVGNRKSKGLESFVSPVSDPAGNVDGQGTAVVSPEKKIKFFYSINTKARTFVKHETKEAAMLLMENMKNLDSESAQKYIVQDFSSDDSVRAYLDSLDFMKGSKTSTNSTGMYTICYLDCICFHNCYWV